MYSTSQNLPAASAPRLNQAPIDKLIEITLCNFLQITSMQITDKAFGHPLFDQIIPPDHMVLRIYSKIEQACPKMMRKILVA
uniref:Uncharacterized protein n=1 Tax=Arundo donax TaxID=35708 RepID=A0A0A9APN2_ARUDO